MRDRKLLAIGWLYGLKRGTTGSIPPNLQLDLPRFWPICYLASGMECLPLGLRFDCRPRPRGNAHNFPVLTQPGRSSPVLLTYRRVDRGRSQGGDRIHGPATFDDLVHRISGVVDRSGRTRAGPGSKPGPIRSQPTAPAKLPEDLALPADRGGSDADERAPAPVKPDRKGRDQIEKENRREQRRVEPGRYGLEERTTEFAGG